ncbi:MAG: thymidine phosphorylase [Bacilli bacterium]|nr:thymidine phosphorylase [Bacilli bacterium]
MLREIKKLEEKQKLSYKELDTIFSGYLNKKIDDDEMTKVLKLICKNGLSEEETINLTDIFINSGAKFPMNISFVDKHSTGGVGDKTTLIVLPILASLGVRISKMSGKALGYTGGTIDKLNSIGVKTNLTKKEFYTAIDKTNMVISSQTENLCPMDKKVYALRDVTGTTKSIPLIAASIMSKKIASGAGKILIDIKVGKGALIENKKQAMELAALMIKIGKKYDRKVICMLTRMDNPLGDNVGNKIEVQEVIDILKNKKKGNLTNLCVEMATLMYTLTKDISKEKARSMVKEVLNNGEAYKKFESYVKLEGGSLEDIDTECADLVSLKSGYIKSINSRVIGETSMLLGAGRVKKTDSINYDAGVVLVKNVGSKVKKGDVICKLYGKSINYDPVYKAFSYSKLKPSIKGIIINVVE